MRLRLLLWRRTRPRWRIGLQLARLAPPPPRTPPRPRGLGAVARCARPCAVGTPALSAGLHLRIAGRVARSGRIPVARRLLQRVHPHAHRHGGRARPRRLPGSGGRDALLLGGRNAPRHGRGSCPRRHRLGGRPASRSLHDGGRKRRHALRGRPQNGGLRHGAAH